MCACSQPFFGLAMCITEVYRDFNDRYNITFLYFLGGAGEEPRFVELMIAGELLSLTTTFRQGHILNGTFVVGSYKCCMNTLVPPTPRRKDKNQSLCYLPIAQYGDWCVCVCVCMCV